MASTTSLLMPKLGLTMTEGTLTEWLVSVGDQVNKGEVLCTVETDKIVNEVEARGDGRIISIDVKEGTTVPVGSILATWTGPGDTIDAPDEAEIGNAIEPAEPEKAGSEDTVRRNPPKRREGDPRIIATPLAKRTAAELGVDLKSVEGSGPNGRIKVADVEKAVAQKTTTVELLPPTAGEKSRRPATGTQSIIARRLTQSKQTIPHFYVITEAEVSKLIALKDELNAVQEVSERATLNHLILLAVARALASIPDMNAIWDDGDIVTFERIDVGLAVDTPRGIVAPVLHDVGRRGIRDLVASANEAVEKARSGTLAGEDLAGGAVTVSNVGMFGASALVPIINPGQSGILGVGTIKEIFRPDENRQPKLCREISLVLSSDHRVFDGVAAARFLDRIRSLIETPLQLLIH